MMRWCHAATRAVLGPAALQEITSPGLAADVAQDWRRFSYIALFPNSPDRP